MLSKRTLLLAVSIGILFPACKKNTAKPEPDTETENEIYVLGYSQNAESEYEKHYLWNKKEVKNFPQLNLETEGSIQYGVVDGNDILLAQNGSFWRNDLKTVQFQAGGITTNVAYRYYNHTLASLIRKPAQDPEGHFDYSVMEDGTTVFTVSANAENRYEFKDFLKVADTYYLLGLRTTINTEPIIYCKNATTTTVIVLNTTPGTNFQAFRLISTGAKFYALGYINQNGTLKGAVLSLNHNGADKVLTELNVPANVVLSDFLVDGTDLYVTGWEPKDNSGSYFAFYLKNDQKISLSNKQSRAMRLLKHKGDVYVAGLEWEPSLSYKIWKNGQEYGVLKSENNKPIVPLQLFAR